jgi:hypothetical protein
MPQIQSELPLPGAPPSAVRQLTKTYGETFRHELDQGRQAFAGLIADMQQANSRWMARRQEMMSANAAFWLDPKAMTPGGVALAWRRWAQACTQRWIDDITDQVDIGVKTAQRLSETMPVSAPKAMAEATPKPRKAKPRAKHGKPNGATTH